METQKIVNLSNDSNNEYSKFATKRWYIISDQNNGQYGRGNENESAIKIADIATNTNVAFKNCAPFTRCETHTNDKHVETAENLDIIMPVYNLIEYSDNYADSSESLY